MVKSPDTLIGQAGQIVDLLHRHSPDARLHPHTAAVIALAHGGLSEAHDVYNSRHHLDPQNVGDSGIVFDTHGHPGNLRREPAPQELVPTH